MKSSTLSSSYKVYNDKEMASEYSDYTDLIKKWEEKLQDKEDYYYNKFSCDGNSIIQAEQPDILTVESVWKLDGIMP